MTPSIRLGRLFGIEIGFNWSLIFIFALVTWTLATAVLPANASGHAALVYWAVAVVGAFLFYVCLLAHELSHSLVARRYGVKVEGITLWLFGGVSRLEGEPATARSEALIAGVGPLTSLVIAAVCVALFYVTSGSDLLANLFGWLAFVNLALALFNLVPAFPLDGGRLLSSLLWWRSGSRQRGIHNAVRVGRVFAYLMIAGGVLEVFLGAGFSGIWLAILGWFLLSAAASEEAGSAVRTLLRNVPVSAAMSSPVVTLPDWVTVEQFLTSIAPDHSFTTYPVHEPSGRLTGVVRLSDLVRVPSAERGNRHLVDVARAVAEVPVSNPREDLAALIQRIGTGLDQRVLVFDNGQLVGIVSPADIARVLALRQARAGGQRPAA
ncbi:MAG TPA: site-2 protease family protein [Candidatus Dormibacteraeota bacterium]|nr:site-2 protease family protein [Candidatus Dormibacteraeota bacterium]